MKLYSQSEALRGATMSERKHCIDCPNPITDEARRLNQSELWCVACEKKRRKRLTKEFHAITESFGK